MKNLGIWTLDRKAHQVFKAARHLDIPSNICNDRSQTNRDKIIKCIKHNRMLWIINTWHMKVLISQ